MFEGFTMEIITNEEKEMIPLSNEEIKSYEKHEVCHICKKEFCFVDNEKNEFKLYHKVRDHCHYTGKFRGAAHNISYLRCNVPKEIPIVAHSATFQIKQLVK